MTDAIINLDDVGFRNHLKNIGINTLKYGRKLMRERASLTVRELKKSEPDVSGTLKRRTRKEPVRKGWGYRILMPYYAEYVDRGTGTGKMMPVSNALKYRRLYGIRNINAWRRHIAKHGIKAHPFIQIALRRSERRSPELYKKYLELMIKK